MEHNKNQNLLRKLPGVDHLLELIKKDTSFKQLPLNVCKSSIRYALENIRTNILNEKKVDLSDKTILATVFKHANNDIKNNLIGVINATGVVLHTNLGRSLLCKEALKNITDISSGYSNLEYNIDKGTRGIRYSAVEDLLCELTGAEAALVVNNNAGAVLLSLNSLAENKEVIVSRGELVEIGGAFRIPDVMTKSNAILKEVGTTNRTHARDYTMAISDNTGLFLKVHTSNYQIEGFTSSVPVADLVTIGKKHGIPVMEDLGSGMLIDFSKYGLGSEPTIRDSVKSGADVISFSGDKLLGGPQAGIILGKKDIINIIKNNPLTRALRIDKLTLAALESTLRLYRDEENVIKKIPTLRMLTDSYTNIKKRASTILKRLEPVLPKHVEIKLADLSSRPGGGAFPSLTLPSSCITIKSAKISAVELEKKLRKNDTPVIGRIEDNCFVIDPRTIQKGEEKIICKTLIKILN
ncbi:MAG: L-seryl-tRNA(Sec) selenium transferase [Desulfobacteraceae bacterium]|nr:L-seryl-tRNA(Sec) selenium transferase [Desulfobacteraceae bacterium]